jgi:hypothetical protein
MVDELHDDEVLLWGDGGVLRESKRPWQQHLGREDEREGWFLWENSEISGINGQGWKGRGEGGRRKSGWRESGGKRRWVILYNNHDLLRVNEVNYIQS